jgi:hypothetical protein
MSEEKIDILGLPIEPPPETVIKGPITVKKNRWGTVWLSDGEGRLLASVWEGCNGDRPGLADKLAELINKGLGAGL